MLAGTDTPYGITVLAFAPQTIKVHRGDTITWQFLSYHNVRFASKPADLVVIADIDGKQIPEINPVIAFPTLKSGDVYKAEAGSGLPAGPESLTFSVVMDVAPGTYTYVCDLHPGMVGFISVVDDATAIPSPADVAKESVSNMDSSVAAADKVFWDMIKASAPQAQGDSLPVWAGGATENAAILKFFPDVAQIQVGQSVTWTVPKGFDTHTINIPLPKDSGIPEPINLMFDSKKAPHGTISEALNPTLKSGDALPDNGTAQSGLLIPGQSFTVKFTKPGLYSYFCVLHPGQIGTVAVLPPQ